ncbi:MAG: AAA family ATPase [Saprospiraceae bacterium]|nr:AAA family ATPase [Saprospiraceae bacterium]
MEPGIQHIHHLQRILSIEKKADLTTWQEKVARMSGDDRVRHGLTWRPVSVIKSGFAMGDKAFVTVQRSVHQRHDSQFKAGSPVTFFTEAAMAKRNRISGVVHYATEQRMQIILNTDDLPDWLNMGPLGVDLEFDNRTYTEMEKALVRALEAQGNTLVEFRQILSGHRLPAFGTAPDLAYPDGLNHAQANAVRGILAARELALVHGPPGTGKTTTLVAAVRELVIREGTVLVCAASNTATDVLTERLAARGLRVVRIGHISRVDERLLDLTLDGQVAAHPDSREIKKVKIKAAQARKKAGTYKRTFDADARADRRDGYQEARELMDWARHLETRLVEQILDSAQVICTTLTGAAHSLLDKRRFATLIVDEAAQALEPAVWIPLARVERLVLAGDPHQLPPTVKSSEAAREGLNITLMERLLPSLPQVHLLTVQYRMHPAIMAFSNSWFYQDQLIASPGLEYRELPVSDARPVLFIDTAGCGFEEKVNPETRSRYNPDEYVLITCHLESLRQDLLEKEWPEIALLSPYREQVEYIEEEIQKDEHYNGLPIRVQTIDGFQGQEMDVVILSLVRSNGRSEIGFLQDYRRMNVAMTRAQRQLVVIGDSATIGGDPFYAQFLDHCQATGAWRSAWEYVNR